MNKKFVISEELLLAVIKYLIQRPYAEVFQLVHLLQAIPVATEDDGTEDND